MPFVIAHKKPSATCVTEGYDIKPRHLRRVANYPRLQLSPQLQCSHPHDSQVQFSHVPSAQPQSSHWQFSPQQQLLAAESAAKLLKPSTDAPATATVANSFEVRDIDKSPASTSSRELILKVTGIYQRTGKRLTY